jgi:arabinose-5-phosphate isomerase
MRTGDRLPVLPDTRSVQDAILGMTQSKAGCAALIDEATGRLTGILTDGDFRRSILSGPDFLAQPVSEFMTRTPKTVGAEALGVEVLRMFDRYKIDDIIVVDEAGRPVGLVDVQDLPKMKFL